VDFSIALLQPKETEMNNTAEKLAETAKATLEATQTIAINGQVGLEKLVDLNMTTTKTALGESFAHAIAVLGAKDAQELVALQAGLTKPLAKQFAAYAQDFQKIVAGISEDFTKAALANTADLRKAFAKAQSSAKQVIEAAQTTFTAVAVQATEVVKPATKTA
jgi:phasin family protein